MNLPCAYNRICYLCCSHLVTKIHFSSYTVATCRVMQSISINTCCIYNSSPRQRISLPLANYRVGNLLGWCLNSQVYLSSYTVAACHVMQCISVNTCCVYNSSPWQREGLSFADDRVRSLEQRCL